MDRDRYIGTQMDRDTDGQGQNRDTDGPGQGHRRTGTGTQMDRGNYTKGQGK
jgi:hypothetical protein